MRVLVLGGAGYIGSHVVRELLDQEHEVSVFDDLSTGLRENLFAEATFRQGDILDAAALDEGFRDARPEAVIHLAALKAAGESMTLPEKYARNNVVGSVNVLNACASWETKSLVFSSSAAVYGAPQVLPMDEAHPTRPENFYGATKLLIENLMSWYDRLRGLRYAALRYFNAAGYDVKGRIFGLERNPANLIPVVMETVAGIRKELLVFGNDYETPDGTGVRDYVHVNDLATAHAAALARLEQTGESLTVNLGTGRGYSVLDVVRGTERVTGRPVPHRIVDRRPGDPAELWASSKLAATLIGWEPRHSDLETILESTWQAYLSSGVGA
jgi:UDP-glucose 4-epimerase